MACGNIKHVRCVVNGLRHTKPLVCFCFFVFFKHFQVKNHSKCLKCFKPAVLDCTGISLLIVYVIVIIHRSTTPDYSTQKANSVSVYSHPLVSTSCQSCQFLFNILLRDLFLLLQTSRTFTSTTKT